MAAFAYVTVEQAAAALVGVEVSDPPTVARLTRLIAVAGAQINNYCRRVFVPTVQTRVLDAPAAGTLATPWALSPYPDLNPFLAQSVLHVPTALVALPDLQPSPAPTITAFGVPLTTDDYQLLTYRDDSGAPAGQYLVRVAAGQPVSWYYNALAWGQPYGAIRVAGTFSYDSTVPAAVTQAAEILVARWWTSALRQYGQVSGNAQQSGYTAREGILDQDVTDLLRPYQLNQAMELAL